MTKEAYTPDEFIDGTRDHGVFWHRKTALKARVIERDGVITLHDPETGDELPELTETFRGEILEGAEVE